MLKFLVSFRINLSTRGYIPLIGAVNGVLSSTTAGKVLGDGVCQPDFNSTITGVPEPGTLSLFGAILAALGLISS